MLLHNRKSLGWTAFLNLGGSLIIFEFVKNITKISNQKDFFPLDMYHLAEYSAADCDFWPESSRKSASP